MERSIFEFKLLEKLNVTWNMFTKELPLDYDVEVALKKLYDFDKKYTKDFLIYSDEVMSASRFIPDSEQEYGMNSPGILWDRLTILNCKFFFTDPISPHFKPNIHTKKTDVRIELKSVLNALHLAKPAKNILLAKEATVRQKNVNSIGKSLWELQSSNLAMWINQDLLYTVNVDDVGPKRLKDYIKFFSFANRVRNTAIEKIEIYYSTKILKKD